MNVYQLRCRRLKRRLQRAALKQGCASLQRSARQASCGTDRQGWTCQMCSRLPPGCSSAKHSAEAKGPLAGVAWQGFNLWTTQSSGMVVGARWTGSGGCSKCFSCAVQAFFVCFVLFFVVLLLSSCCLHVKES